MTAEGIAVQIVVSILTGGVVAYLTVLLALNRFRQERWWEKKLEAYTDIVMALHHIKRDLDEDFSSIQFDRERKENDPLAQKHMDSLADLQRIVAMGELLISEQAMTILGDMFAAIGAASALGREEGYWAYIEGYQFAVIQCLKDIKPAAKVDLKLAPFRWRWSRNAVQRSLQ